jgi:hypothetical protein
MTRTRLASLTLLVALGFALLPQGTRAQDKDKETALPTRPSGAFTKVREYRDKGRLNADDIKPLAEAAKTFAQYHADFISSDLVYRVIQDPSLKLPLNVYPAELVIDDRIADMTRHLLEPHYRNKDGVGALRVTRDNMDYIREMGKALDDAFMKVVKGTAKPIVKVNAMRFYVAACKTGAPAHWPTLTALLTDPKTKPEIRVFALQAAANLLWAYDPDFYQSRRHSIGSKQPRAAADQEIGALVKAVQDCVTTPKLLVPDWPDGKDPMVKPTDNQVEVLKYMRREAIRALAQVRFAKMPGPQAGQFIYPAYTLARVCMLDPTLGPTPTPSECGEAVIGLCNMAPVWDGAPVKEFNADAVALAVAKGMVNFATPRIAADNRDLPWTGYAMRMGDAFGAWPAIFSFLHDPLRPNPADADSAPAVVKDLIRRATNSVTTPLSGKNGNITLTDLEQFIRTQEEKPNVGVLFNGVDQTALPGFQKK